MAEQMRELWAYSTHNSCEDQEEGFWEAMHRRAVSNSWFMRSVCPLV